MSSKANDQENLNLKIWSTNKAKDQEPLNLKIRTSRKANDHEHLSLEIRMSRKADDHEPSLKIQTSIKWMSMKQTTKRALKMV